MLSLYLTLLISNQTFEVTVAQEKYLETTQATDGHRRAGDFPTCTGRAGASPAAIVTIDEFLSFSVKINFC